jgi:hypothetical protein
MARGRFAHPSPKRFAFRPSLKGRVGIWRDHDATFSIFVMPPIYGTNTSGTRMLPSGS